MRADPAPEDTVAHKRGGLSPMRLRPSTGRWAIWIVDAVLVIWALAWIIIGLAVARDVRNLSALSDNVVQAGTAVGETGRALRALERLPFVGDQIAGVARQIDAAAS